MRFTLPIISIFLLLSGEAFARTAFPHRKAHNATLDALIAKRQTNRHQIQLRAHVKDTVKRVHKQLSEDREEAVAQVTTTTTGEVILPRTPTRANLAPRQEVSQNPGGGAVVDRRALPAPARARALAPRQAASDTPVIAGPDRRRRSREARAPEEELEPRSNYPKCKKTTARTGYAHYPGWKLVGDELSGAIPVKPESACIQACNRYGGACSGVFFDSANGKCYLKGVKTSVWDFVEGPSEDGTDLIGGCSLWSNIVPPEMDAVCCRD